uniref:CLV3/ESR-related protein n=1 Tax=Ginkgo biloba TaxID=3311 RepID=A0A0U2SIR6_GINBI|nr:CLV3/ESR-related protein [Ginkgo biloba]
MADEALRCCSTYRRLRIRHRRGKTSNYRPSGSDRVRKRCTSAFILVLLLLAVFCRPLESARTINACRTAKKQRGMVVSTHVRRSQRDSNRRLIASNNNFHIPPNNQTARHRPTAPSTASTRYNASDHEVPSGPNPISN